MIYDGYMRSVPGVAGAGTCKWRIDVGRVGSRIVRALLSELCGESGCRVDVELFPLIVSYSGDARLVETSWGSINWGAYLGLGDPYNTILPLVDANHVLPLLKRLERVYGILEENYRIILVDDRGLLTLHTGIVMRSHDGRVTVRSEPTGTEEVKVTVIEDGEKKLRETVYERHWTRYLLETLGLA